MSFMKRQAARLLRGKFKDQLLAEEVYAIFATDEVIEIDSPVKIGPTGESVPPLTIINNPSRTPIPPIVIGEGGPEVPSVDLPDGVEPFTPSDTPSGGGGNAFSAQVGSQVGGVNYNCIIYPGGTAVVVEMKNLAVTAGLPSGIWVQVVKVGDIYHGFPNVFYGPGT